jgi:hypothetical protein
VGILIGFCNLALVNRICSGQASSGITDGPTFAKPLTLCASYIFNNIGNSYMSRFNFWSFKDDKKKIKALYNDTKNLSVIEFANNTSLSRFVWVEPTCVSLEIDPNTEYQIITHDKTFRIEFEKEETITFYLQYSFGFILNKRTVSDKLPNPNPWTLDIDCSDIN